MGAGAGDLQFRGAINGYPSAPRPVAQSGITDLALGVSHGCGL